MQRRASFPRAAAGSRDGRVTVFLGGPIKAGFTGAEFDGDLRTRTLQLIAGLRAAGVVVVSAHEAEAFSRLQPSHRSGISARDDAWLRACDAYVAHLPLTAGGSVYPSVGTGIELGWALRDGIPAFALVDMARRSAYSPFLLDLSDRGELELFDAETAASSPALLAERIRLRLGQTP